MMHGLSKNVGFSTNALFLEDPTSTRSNIFEDSEQHRNCDGVQIDFLGSYNILLHSLGYEFLLPMSELADNEKLELLEILKFYCLVNS